jgi:hypothetical protein
MQKRFDNLLIGLFVGLLGPIIALFLYYSFTYRYQTSFSGFVEYFTRLNIIVPSMSLACYGSNLPLFFLFLWRDHYKSARGVLFATIAYTAWVVYHKAF